MPKILIVEDEKNLAAAYQTILEKHGYKVELAYNGQQALDAVAKDMPNLILLDMKMPKMGGLDFLRELDKLSIDSSEHVIVFSNQDAGSDIEEAFRLGANRYLLKSWASPGDLAKVVQEALS